MSDIVIAAIIASMTSLLLIVIKKVNNLHSQLNSRLDQWKRETEKAAIESAIAAYARGVKDESDKHI